MRIYSNTLTFNQVTWELAMYSASLEEIEQYSSVLYYEGYSEKLLLFFIIHIQKKGGNP